MNALQSTVAALGRFQNSPDIDFEEDVNSVTSISQSITVKIATITTAYFRLRKREDPIDLHDNLSHAANFLHMMHGEVPDDAEIEAIDTSLEIHMDHGMNASTFTSRIIASPYQAIAGGIGAFAGSLHGGANQDFINMVEEIEATEKDIEEWIDDYLEGGRGSSTGTDIGYTT